MFPFLMIVNNTLNDTNSVFYPLSAILHPCGGEASIHYHSWIFLNIPFHMVYFLVRNLFIIFCVYLHRDVQPVWNKYRLAGTNDSHQPEHEDSNFPARLSSIVGEERWCGGCRHVWGSHALYSYSHYTLLLHNSNGGYRVGWSFIGYNAFI